MSEHDLRCEVLYLRRLVDRLTSTSAGAPLTSTSNIAIEAIVLGKLGLIERLVGPMERGGVGHTDHDDATGKCLTCEIRKVLSGND